MAPIANTVCGLPCSLKMTFRLAVVNALALINKLPYITFAPFGAFFFELVTGQTERKRCIIWLPRGRAT